MSRLVEAWRRMDSERRFAAVAALGLFVSMFLPWYQQNGVVKAGSLESRNLDAFQVFSLVEAAVLVVAVALLYMLYARADGRDFRVPGGDGTILLLAGLWIGALLIFRLFDKPGVSSHGVAANVGVQWGIFFALAAAGLIAYSGSRIRGLRAGPRLSARPHGARPDDHLRSEPRERGPGAREERFPAPPPDLPTELRDPGEAPTAAESQATRVVPAGRPAAATPAGARGRPRYPPAPSEPTLAGTGEQLSFEDTPAHTDEP
ncbi:MAG: hypothetical protein ACYDC2_04735 [Solirubrobacteraceae bacterium]